MTIPSTNNVTPEALKTVAINAIEDLKGQDIVVLDVKEKASFTDYMIIASGTSDRHLKAMANQVHIDSKAAGFPPLSTEGKETQNWILVDLGDVVVHLMRPETRDLYEIEKLWSIGSPKRETHAKTTS